MTQETKVPAVIQKKRRTHLQRQRLAVIIVACVVVALAITFGIVYHFTSRIIFTDDDGTRYFVRQRDLTTTQYNGEVVVLEDQYVLEDEEGNMMPRDNTSFNYYTKLNTIVNVDPDTGVYTVVAKVLTAGGETTEFNSSSNEFDVLLYPYLSNEQISSIHVSNKNGSFTFVKDEKGTFHIEGHEGLPGINATMFGTLVNLTGYTTTMARISFQTAFDPNAEDYDAYEGFRLNGYREYGLPDDPNEATTYFIIKGKGADGQWVEHKVIIGDPILSGVGYYVRYVGRDEVYVLREMEETENYTTLSATLLGRMEDYVTPMVTVPMSTNNYFDVQNFSLSVLEKGAEEFFELIGFSYLPIENREGKFAANYPYELVMKNGALKGYNVNSYRVDDCLQHLQSIKPLRTVKLYSEYPTEEDPDVSLNRFLEEYWSKESGLKLYTVGFDFVAKRDEKTAEPVEGEVYPQQIWIAENEAGTYYLFNAEFNMVVECSVEYLEFLEWNRFEWIESDIFSGNVAYVEKIEILMPGGIGTLNGANRVVLYFDNSQSELPSKENNFMVSSNKLSITADYGSMVGVKVDVKQFRLFYQTLLISSLEGMMPTGTEQKQQDLIASGDAGAEMVIKMTYNADGEELVRTYRFYSRANGNLNAFVTLNGTGSFYMLQRRVDKIISDVAKIFNPAETIDPESKF